MKSFSVSLEVLDPPLIKPPLTLTSLVMFTLFTKSPGIVESLFSQRLSPRPKVFKSEKAWSFVIDKFVNSTWC